MRAAWVIARADIARRWKALVALSVLTGLAGAVVLACAAGARRTDTVYQRLLAASRAYDAEVSIVGDVSSSGLSEEQVMERIKALPQVEEHGSVAIIPADVAGSTEPFRWSRNVGTVVDPGLGRTFEIARVVAGRHPDVDEPYEAAVSAALLEAQGLSIGDTIAFQPVTFDELFAFFGGRVIHDPKPEPIEVRIVGAWRLPHDIRFSGDSTGLIYLTPAFARGPARELATLPLTYVRLHGGAVAYEDFAEQARAIAGDPDAIDVGSRAELVNTVERAVDVQATALLAFAALAGLTGVLIIGQAIGRHVNQSADADDVLIALGASRSTLASSRVFTVVPLAAAAVVIAVAGAIAASRAFPIGFTRPIEPDPGVSVHAATLAVGTGALFAFVLVRAALATLLQKRRLVEPGARPARLAELAARAGSSPALVAGLRFATMRGKGRSSVPLLTALSGTFIGVAALIAAVTFASSFEGLLRSPHEYGWTWEMTVAGGEDPADIAPLSDALVRSEHTQDVTKLHTVATRLDGATVSVIGYQQMKGDLRFRLLVGRMPSDSSEIVLAKQTLANASARVGQTVQLERPSDQCETGAPCKSTMRVVGTFVMPALEDAPTDEGALVSLNALPSIASTDGFSDFVVNLKPGSPPASIHAITDETNREEGPGQPSVEIENLSRVRSMPFALAAALGLMALATLLHLLVTSVRRRRPDLAVLKTLGFVRGQVRATVGWLATTVVVVALAVGAPVGIAAGRWTWRALNSMLGTGAPPALPSAVIALGALVAIVIANVVAALPARSAARTQPAVVLRTE